MKMRKNARMTPLHREDGERRARRETGHAEAAASLGVRTKTAALWAGHLRALGPTGCADRSSMPRRMHRPMPAHVVERIVSSRWRRTTGTRIASATGASRSAADRVLKRAGLSRIKDLDPEEPARRHQHDDPGDMIHLDIKKPSRFEAPGHRATGTRAGHRQGSGWKHDRICVDDASRIACDGLFPRREAPERHRVPEGVRGLTRASGSPSGGR